MAFMRMYGTAGDPGPRPAPRRKSAAAGPRAKAGRKRMVRAQRAARGKQGAAKGPGKKKKGSALGAALGDRLGGILEQVRGGNLAAAAGQAVLGTGRKLNLGGGGGHRRVNPANVKALRRSLRRVEQFGHLVSRVNKLLPRAHKFNVHPVLKHKRKRRVA